MSALRKAFDRPFANDRSLQGGGALRQAAWPRPGAMTPASDVGARNSQKPRARTAFPSRFGSICYHFAFAIYIVSPSRGKGHRADRWCSNGGGVARSCKAFDGTKADGRRSVPTPCSRAAGRRAARGVDVTNCRRGGGQT